MDEHVQRQLAGGRVPGSGGVGAQGHGGALEADGLEGAAGGRTSTDRPGAGEDNLQLARRPRPPEMAEVAPAETRRRIHGVSSEMRRTVVRERDRAALLEADGGRRPGNPTSPTLTRPAAVAPLGEGHRLRRPVGEPIEAKAAAAFLCGRLPCCTFGRVLHPQRGHSPRTGPGWRRHGIKTRISPSVVG